MKSLILVFLLLICFLKLKSQPNEDHNYIIFRINPDSTEFIAFRIDTIYKYIKITIENNKIISEYPFIIEVDDIKGKLKIIDIKLHEIYIFYRREDEIKYM